MKTFVFALIILCPLLMEHQLMAKDKVNAEVQTQKEMPEKWYQLMELISKEAQTINALGELSPRLTQRLIELYTERLKLIKELENKRFLAASEVERKKGRSHFFKSSTSNQKQIEQIGLQLIKNFPNFIGNAEIFHTLALNSRDYGANDRTEQFLLNSLRLAPVRSPVIYGAQVGLAEHYYNDKQYKKALHYYEAVLKNTADEWHTKHLYNAAWCYLQTQATDTAIEYLVKAHDLGLSGPYVSMKEQVLDSAGAFFVMGERSLEGAQFYLKNISPPTDYLLKMARRISERGNFSDTKAVIDITLKEAKKRDDLNHQMDTHLVELDVYRHFNKNDLHFVTAQNIRNIHLKQALTGHYSEDSIYKVKELVGYLQIRLSKNAKIRQSNSDPQLLKRIIDYFDILSVIDQLNQDEYHYFQGESFFSVSEYKDAAIVYQKGLEVIKKKMSESTPEKPIIVSDQLKRKILDALLSVLEYGQLEEPLKTQVTLYSFGHYIRFWPIDEKSRLIYRSLFNLLFERKDYARAVQVMETYHTNYPTGLDLQTQQAMLTRLVDQSIETKDTDKLAQWISRISTGFLSFDTAFTEKATLVLGQLLFETFSNLDKSGQKDQALAGYMNIYQDPRYPQKIKADSSYATALIFADMGNLIKSYEWMMISFNHFEDADLFEKREALFALHELYFLRQDHALSIKLGNNIIQEFCGKEFKRKKQIISNIIYFSLLEKQTQNAQTSLELFAKCPLSLKDSSLGRAAMLESLTQLIQFHLTHRQWNDFLKYVTNYSKRSDTPQELIDIMVRGVLSMYWDASFTTDTKQQQIALSFLKNLKDQSLPKAMKHEIESLLKFREQFTQVEKFRLKPFTVTNPFNDEIFNKELDLLAAEVQKVTTLAEEFIKMGIPEIVLLSSFKIGEIYQAFGEQILATHPQGMEVEYVQSFKGAMTGMGQGLIQRGLTYQKQSQDLMSKNKTQTAYNHYLTNEKILRDKFRYRYMATDLMAPMDMSLQILSREVAGAGEKR